MNKKLVKFISWILLICFIFPLSACNELYEIFPGLCEHEWGEMIELKPATCGEPGKIKYVCKICSTETKKDIGPSGKHSVDSAWKNDNYKHWKKCSNCSYIEQEAEHDFNTQNELLICKECGYEKSKEEQASEISFHFMMLGNEYAGDAIYIKAGENDILIDAGSRESSIPSIKNYIDKYVTDGKLEYVIATHGHQDHIAGFAKSEGSIFDLYECQTIIDFPKTNSTSKTYQRYVQERDAEIALGAIHYTALECYKNQNGAQRVYDLSGDGEITLEILYNYYYDHKSSEENDYSVCVQFVHGQRKFLFTGDLEEKGEEYLVQYNKLDKVELYKAGHHGSKTSSSTAFLSVIQPKMSVVCCCAGFVEYTQTLENTFPTQAYIDRIAPYTYKIFVPNTINLKQVAGANTPNTDDDKYEKDGALLPLNGDVVIVSNSSKEVYPDCSNNNTYLKDTEWFKKYRKMPSEWKNVA